MRFHEQTIREVRRRVNGSPLEQRIEAEEQADRDAAFLFALVTALDATAGEMVRLGGLRYEMLFWEMRAISAEARDGDPAGGDPRLPTTERWSRWRAVVAALRMDLHVQEQAHGLLQGPYLKGRVALFPETVARRERLVEAVEDLAWCGRIIGAAIPGMEPAVDPDPVALEAERLIETVQARALDILGDVDGSAAILTPHVRGTTGAVL